MPSLAVPRHPLLAPSARTLLSSLAGILVLAAQTPGQGRGREPLTRPAEARVPHALPMSAMPVPADEAGAVVRPPDALRTSFEDGWAEITSDGAPALRLSLASWNGGGKRLALAGVEKAVRGNRVEYRRGAVTEWFVDGRRGLQQGFTVTSHPTGNAGTGFELELDLGGWQAEVLPGARNAVLVAPGGEHRLSYSGLLAWDANHVPLDAGLIAREHGLAIHVDDAGAVYPLTVDPLIGTQKTRLEHGDPRANDNFGKAIAMSGNTIVIGAPLDDLNGSNNRGSIDVLIRSGTSWVSQFSPVGSLQGDRLGSAVGIDDSFDNMVIGAPGVDAGGFDATGAAYFYHRTGSTWNFENGWFIGQDGQNFGSSVDVDGDRAIVGFPNDDNNGGTDVGGAVVWLRQGTTWNLEAYLFPSPAVSNTQAGVSVALFGTTAILGAANDSFYVFKRDAGNVWTQTQRITGPAGSEFGSRVAMDQTAIVVGAPGEDHSGLTDAGAVYTYISTGSSLNLDVRRTASDPQDGARYGDAVAVHSYLEPHAVVGAPGQDSSQGSVYLLRKPAGSSWSEQDQLSAAEGVAGDALGTSVALARDQYGGRPTIVAGAPFFDALGRGDAGAATVFRYWAASYPQHFDHSVDFGAFDLDGCDGWVDSGSSYFLEVFPGNYMVVADGESSRIADAASPFPGLDGRERDAFLQFDCLTTDLLGSDITLGVGADENGDGVITPGSEVGPAIVLDAGSVHVRDGNGGSSASAPLPTISLLRLRLVMSLAGSGSGSLFWRDTSVDGPFIPFPELRDVPLRLSRTVTDGRNPTLWNGLFLSGTDPHTLVDNLTLAESASSYDFECLPARDAGVFEPLFEGGWVVTPINTAVRSGVNESLSHDGSKCLGFNQTGPSVGCDQSMVDTEPFGLLFPPYWGLPRFTGDESLVTFQFDATTGFWGNTLGFAYDANQSGHVTSSDGAERAVELTLSASSGNQVRLRAADGTSTAVGLPGGGWWRMKMQMDLRGAGTCNVLGLHLSGGATEFTPIAGLQGIPLALDRAGGKRDPRKWNALFSHFEGGGNYLDNLQFGPLPPRKVKKHENL